MLSTVLHSNWLFCKFCVRWFQRALAGELNSLEPSTDESRSTGNNSRPLVWLPRKIWLSTFVGL